MGKGDQKSRKGKITAGSYGNSRPKKPSVKAYVATEEKPVKEAKPKATTKAKTEKGEETKEAKPKVAKAKKTEE